MTATLAPSKGLAKESPHYFDEPAHLELSLDESDASSADYKLGERSDGAPSGTARGHLQTGPSSSTSAHGDQGAHYDPADPAVSAALDDDDDKALPSYDQARAKLLRNRQTLGAGVAGAAVGLVLTGSPFLSVAVGGAAAYAAQQPGKTGDTMRKVGDRTMDGVERIRALMREHRLGERAHAAAAVATERATELDQQLRLSERIRTAAEHCASEARAFEARTRMAERARAAIGVPLHDAGAPQPPSMAPAGSVPVGSPVDAHQQQQPVTLGIPVDEEASQFRGAELPRHPVHAAN
jgi:hypothetical protein